MWNGKKYFHYAFFSSFLELVSHGHYEMLLYEGKNSMQIIKKNSFYVFQWKKEKKKHTGEQK